MTTVRDGLRQGARAFGARAEALAAAFLERQGYQILARGFVIPGGEIDLIARRDDAVAFVEVKARPKMDAALAAISQTKRRRIARAAAGWLAKNPWAADGYALRGDAVFVDERRAPLHIVDAFTLEFEG